MYDKVTGIFQAPPREPIEIGKYTIGEYVRNGLKTLPQDFEIVIHGETGETITVGQLLSKSESILRSLKALNLKDNGVITLVGSYGINQISLLLGALLYGAPFFPTDPIQKTYEIQHIFTVQRPEIVFAEKDTIDHVLEALNNLKISPKLFLIDSDEEVRGVKTFNDFLKNTAECEIRRDFDIRKKVATIMPSSGTTGKPKGVAWTHSYLLYCMHLFKKTLEVFGREKSYLSVTQLFWASGTVSLLSSLSNGIIYVYVRRNKSPDAILQAIGKYKPITLVFPPSTLSAVLNHPDFFKVDKSTVKKILVGGSALPPTTVKETREKWENIDNIFFTQLYGATEILTTVTTPIYRNILSPIQSVGYLANGFKAKVVDSDGKNLPPNEIGEILLFSEGCKTYYVNNPEATANAYDPEGFYRTGDLGYFTEEGLVYITGRIKELIKSHGHQVAPVEIEDIILAMEGVKDASVFGIPHPTKDYFPCAAVVLAPGAKVTEQDIIKEVAEKLSFPKHLHGGVKFVSQIPYNTNGKKLRRKVPEMLGINAEK